jgi:two-component system, NtrC family, sensor kinase
MNLMELNVAPISTFTPTGLAAPNGEIYADAEKHPRILIVDDSVVVRRSFSKILASGYSCVEAESATEALTCLREAPFDLVITDIMMPGLSGIELLRKVIETYPETAVLVVSGVDRPQRALDAVRLGAFDYLIKPCDPAVLQLTVERALERRTLIENANRYKRDLEERNDELLRGKRQLERLQAQIVHSEKMASLGQLAAGIAHELNNPVGFVYGNLELMEVCIRDLFRLLRFYDNAGLTGEVAERAEAIKHEIAYEQTLADLSSIVSDCRDGAERVRDIVQNLRTFSRLDEAEFKTTDIHEGLESTIRLLSRYFSSGKVRLLRDYGELPTVEAFSAQLNQVWANLLVNAAQAVSAEGGEVTIKTYTEGDSIVVAVIDTGVGIPPEVLPRIFDPFFTTKAVGDGTGLGLSISFGIVERHGGRIEMESTPGAGTTAYVRLPRVVRPKAD